MPDTLPLENQNRNWQEGISSASLTPPPTLKYETPKYPPIYPVAGLNVDTVAPLQETAPEKAAGDLNTRLQSLHQRLIGESATRAEEEAKAGIPQMNQTITDLTSRLSALKNEALAIPLQFQNDSEGRARTAAGLAPLQMAAQRTNAIQSLSTASLLEAARGNLTTALDHVDRSVSQKYDPIRAEIDASMKNLQLIINSPAYSIADKNRAEATLRAKEAEAAALAEQESNEKTIYDIMLKASQSGADPVTLRNIQTSGSPEEALQFAAPFMQTSRTQVLGSASTGYFTYDPVSGQTKRIGGGGSSSNGGGTASTTGLEFGTPDYIISRLRGTSGSKTKPVASEREQLGKFANVVALTDNLMKSLNKTTNDPIIGYMRSLNPYDFDARAVNAQVTALVPSVARGLYGEVGVLTDSDIERYLQTLPNIKSTSDQNKFIAMMTLANAKRSYEQTLLNLASSNVNVSGFVDSYRDMSDRLGRLEKELSADAPHPMSADETADLEFSPDDDPSGALGKVGGAIKWLFGF